MNETKLSNNPTLDKIELIRNYQSKKISLDDAVNNIYKIDNPPSPRILQVIKIIFLILLAPLISHGQKDK